MEETAGAGSSRSAEAAPVQMRMWMSSLQRQADFIIEKDKASIGMLQRVFKIGFNRAATDHGSALRCRSRWAGRGNKATENSDVHEEEFENYLEQN